MRRLLTLAAGLAAALAVVGCGEAGDGVVAPPPQDGVDVAAYTVTLRVDPATLHLAGRARLDVRHPAGLGTLVLALDDGMEVQAIRVDGQPVQAQRDGDALALPIAPGDTLSAVEVVYRGVPRAGLYRGEHEGQTVVYTDSWPDRGAAWLPGVHHPADPARLDLTLTVPVPFEVVASGAAVSDTVAGGWRTARFRLEADAPVYTFAFALADFEVTLDAAGAVPVRHALLAASAGLAGRLSRTGAALDTLAALLGPYPFASYTTVQVPMAYAGMENAAAPFLRADLYRADVVGRNAIEEVDVHELVHQWWGNAVVPAGWRDLWLAEGPATYLTAEVYRRLDGDDTGRRHLVLLARETPRADARRALVPDRLADPDDALSLTVYNKGAAVLHLLRLTVGEGPFWSALRAVQRDYADRPLSTAAFQAEMEAAGGRDLDALFDYWVDGRRTPRLRTRWDRATRTLSWEVEGDGGTLAGVPFELFVRQGAFEAFVPATDGVASLPGDARPEVLPVGVLLDVD